MRARWRGRKREGQKELSQVPDLTAASQVRVVAPQPRRLRANSLGKQVRSQGPTPHGCAHREPGHLQREVRRCTVRGARAGSPEGRNQPSPSAPPETEVKALSHPVVSLLSSIRINSRRPGAWPESGKGWTEGWQRLGACFSQGQAENDVWPEPAKQ